MSGKGLIYKLEISFSGSVPGQKELLIYLLKKEGLSETDIAESGYGKEKSLSLFFSSRTRAEDLAKKLTGLKRSRLSLTTMRPSDWKTKWKERFKPFRLTGTFTVVPLPFKEKKKFKPETSLFIDSDLAFGVGTHPTTRSMAEFIEERSGQFRDFFDVGTGTGILSIIASRCGAKKIWALDIDREAVETAGRNLAANRCSAEYLEAVDFRSFRRKDQFDLVAANILTHSLIRFRDKLISYVRPGKFLAVSGISTDNYDFFRERFASPGLRCLKIKKESGWSALLFQKIIS